MKKTSVLVTTAAVMALTGCGLFGGRDTSASASRRHAKNALQEQKQVLREAGRGAQHVGSTVAAGAEGAYEGMKEGASEEWNS